MPTPLHLAVALDGAGWHPAAWREDDARPTELWRASYWTELVQLAESALLDLVTIEDGLSLQSDLPFAPDARTDRLRGHLDATLIAARVAPVTRHIGLVPTVVVTHTEPFHVAKAIATLDFASTGRAGVRVKVSGRSDEAAHFGRRDVAPVTAADLDSPQARQWITDAFGEAADVVEVLRRLWDSWEDDAEIRDARTGRFVDREKLHPIDFEGRWFSVRGPSITPRPPQGQPVVAALGHATVPYGLIASSADLGFVTPHSVAEAREIVTEIRDAGGSEVRVLADLVVFLDDDEAAARRRKARLDDRLGAEYASDAEVFVGTPAQLADLLLEWQSAGLAGYRLRPGTLPHDLRAVARSLVPELQRRGAFRTAYDATTLRGHLGLTRPANRYAASA